MPSGEAVGMNSARFPAVSLEVAGLGEAKATGLLAGEAEFQCARQPGKCFCSRYKPALSHVQEKMPGVGLLFV